jgi:hypothetical protein
LLPLSRNSAEGTLTDTSLIEASNCYRQTLIQKQQQLEYLKQSSRLQDLAEQEKRLKKEIHRVT